MRGRQINFFLGAADQDPFERALLQAGDFLILKARVRSPSLETERTTVIQAFGEEPLRVYLARPEDAREIELSLIGETSEYSIDPVLNRVVEFDRCYVAESLIRPGRLYYVPAFFQNGKLLRKPTDFLYWCDRLFREARHQLKKVDRSWYAGPEALVLRQSGWRLEGVVPQEHEPR
jgi:hypothetical protein